jgi:hypothetical protein
VTIRQGKDARLEALANELLSDSAGPNERSLDRDIEKMAYQSGRIGRDELKHYDPDNDWDTLETAYSMSHSPGDLDGITPTESYGRARNQGADRKALLAHHVGDSDPWGRATEHIPALGAYDRGRKTCTKCGITKGVGLFSPDARNKDGRHSWCKACRKAFTSQKRAAETR